MALSDNRRLYDIATRLAVYVEDVKIGQAMQFNTVLFEISNVLKDLLTRVNYKSLDGLSKAQLNKLILDLRESQSKIYSRYTNDLIKQLKEFMAVNVRVNRRIWATSQVEKDSDTEINILTDEESINYIIENSHKKVIPIFGLSAVTGNNEKLWSHITNAPLPANGLYLLPFIKTFTVSAQAGVENIIRKAWSNKWTVKETLDSLVGTGEFSQSSSNQLHKLRNQANSVVHTSFSHVEAVSSAGVQSAIFGEYIWNSVIDSSTTEICISRNKKIFRFGKGPLPPAHIHCRSSIAPFVHGSRIPEESFYTWTANQAPTFQDDILGKSKADLLRSGKLKASDLKKYQTHKPLTFEEFEGKVDEILNRRFSETA